MTIRKPAILAFFSMIHFAAAENHSKRAEVLKKALAESDRLEISETHRGDRKGATFKFTDPKAIKELTKSLDFVDRQSGFHCMCSGDCLISFFHDDKELAVISYHHGYSLRWNGGRWKGDSLFTEDSASSWRSWFQKRGEPRFKKWHEERLREEKAEAEAHQAFMKPFPPALAEIIEDHVSRTSNFLPPLEDEDSLSPAAKKLIAGFDSKRDLAITISKALGSLSLRGDQLGSWSTSSTREQLLLECARSIDQDAMLAASQSSDPATLLGAARVFFFEALYKKFPPDARGPISAKLIEPVIIYDRSYNAAQAIRKLGWYPCPEITQLLVKIALEKIKSPIAESATEIFDEPSAPHAACLLLSTTKSPEFGNCLKHAQKLPTQTPADIQALLIARTNRGEKDLLKKNVFEIDSYTIAFEALSTLEKERSREALSLIIEAATKHSWAAIREEAVLTVERMTGKKWYQGKEHERAEWHGKDIREWWSKEKPTFVFPK